MSIELLKKLRFIAPGIIIFLFAVILGATTRLWRLELPDFEKAMFAPSLLLPGLLYYFTPLRSWVNKPYHKRLIEFIRTELIKAAGVADRPEKYTWRAMKPLFFNLIDNDESLKTKSKLAFFNGMIWTTCADTTALGILYFTISSLMWITLDIEGAFLSSIIFILFSAFGTLGSISTTRKQMKIAEDQIDTIKFKYKHDLEQRIVALDR